MDKVFLFGPLILINNRSFRTNILNISLDRNFPYIHDIVMGIRSVSPTTLIGIISSSTDHYRILEFIFQLFKLNINNFRFSVEW